MRNQELEYAIGLGFLDLAQQEHTTRHYIRLLIEGVQTMADDLSRLTVDVQANSDMIASANSLLNNLAAEIRANQNNPAALADIATKLESNTSELSNAILANTPQSPGPTPPAPTPAQAPDPTAGTPEAPNTPTAPGDAGVPPAPNTPGTPGDPVPPSPETPAP